MVDGVLRHNRSLNQSKRTFGRTLKRRYLAGDPDVYQVKTKPKNIYVYYLNKKIKKKLLQKWYLLIPNQKVFDLYHKIKLREIERNGYFD